MIYQECQGCVATPFCKLYSGESESRHKDWCRAKFRLDKAIGLAGIPSRYMQANIYNFNVDSDNAAVHEAVCNNAENILELVDKGQNFFFYGQRPGSGKTFVATCLLNQYIYKSCMTSRFNFEDPLGMFVDFLDLMDELRYSKDDDDVTQKVESLRNVPLLLLDDLGAGKISDFVREQTLRIINYRLNNGLSTIGTSNFSMKILASDDSLGRRTVSRLMADTIGIEVDSSTDRRRG